MANTTEHVSESPSASSVALPQLRSSRNGSVHSLSTTSRFDKEARAQTLDQIHSSASNTETLTTFNEYTSPPSASSGIDGKGIAGELHGGLSGLYNRLRASVGNVRDIVSHITEDGHPDEKPSRESQLHLSSSTHSNSQSVDSSRASNPSTDSLFKSQGSTVGRPSLAENFGEQNEKDQHNRPKRTSAIAIGVPLQASSSSSSLTSGSIAPLTQSATRAAALPAVAEVNVNAIKERDPGGGHVSSNPIAKSATLLKQPVVMPAEFFLDKSIDKQSVETSVNSVTANDAGQSQKVQASRPILDTTSGATTRFSDQVPNNRLRNPRKNDFATDDRLILSDSGFEPINEPIRSPTKPSASKSKDAAENSRTTTHPATTRGDILPGTQVGDFTSNIAGEPSQKRNHQRPEPSGNKPLVPSRAKLTRSPGSHRSQTSRESATTGLPNTAQQNLSSIEVGEDIDGYRITSQLRTQATSPQNKDARATNVFSQIKSKILNKEYWMRDENARDCFYCGDPFSTFRRKHHCSRYPHENLGCYCIYALRQGHVAKYSMRNAHHSSRVHNLANRGPFEFANPARVLLMDTMIRPTFRKIATCLFLVSGQDMAQQAQVIFLEVRQGLSRLKQKIPIRVRKFQILVFQRWRSLQHVVLGANQTRNLFLRLMQNEL